MEPNKEKRLKYASSIVSLAFILAGKFILEQNLSISILWGILFFVSSQAVLQVENLSQKTKDLKTKVETDIEKLIKDIKALWEMKARDVWGDRLGPSFADCDRTAIHYESLVSKFINEFDGNLPGSFGFVGHIFLRGGVDLSNYGGWIEYLIQGGLIETYETVNFVTPKEILEEATTKRVVENLKGLCCKKKTRIHVFSSSALRKRYEDWKTPEANTVEAFADYIIQEYDQFDTDYKGTGDSSFGTHWVFAEALEKKGKAILGEYSVINRRMTLTFDQNTKFVQLLIGEEPVKLYSTIFDVPDLESIPPTDTDRERRRSEIIDYLKDHRICNE